MYPSGLSVLGIVIGIKNVPLLFMVSLALLSTQPSREILTSNMLSSGASSESKYHIAPWKYTVSPPASQELLGTSSLITKPELSRTLNHPRP